MLRLDVRAAVEIGDRPRNLQHAVIAPRASCAARSNACCISAVHALVQTQQLSRSSAGCISALHCGSSVPAKRAFWILRAASTRFLISADGSAALAAAQLFKLHRRNLYNYINSVKQRPGHAGRDTGRTDACEQVHRPLGSPYQPHLHGIHRAHQHKLARIRHRALHARDGHVRRPQAAGAAPRAYRGEIPAAHRETARPCAPARSRPGRGVCPAAGQRRWRRPYGAARGTASSARAAAPAAEGPCTE